MDTLFGRTSKSRRDFLKCAAAVGLSSGLVTLQGCSCGRRCGSKRHVPVIQKGDTILFQGDSITDAGRARELGEIANDPKALGHGYAFNIASRLLAERPDDELKFFNRGNGGWKVPQLADSWQKNCIDIKPDVLSILIGVNDYWHTIAFGSKYKGTVETYETGYRALLERTFEALPDIKLIICEPFVLKCGHVNDQWFPHFDQYRAVSAKMADEFDALFVPFQSMFDKAAQSRPPKELLGDGVHPSKIGAKLMADEWLRVVLNT